MFYLYILYSESSDRYYVGYTTDIHRRLKEHNDTSHNTYTSKHRPWRLEALFSCGEEESVAIQLEKFIKKQHSRNLLQILINPEYVPNGKLSQLVRVPHVRD